MTGELAAILPLPATLADNTFVPLAGEAALVRVARAMPDTAVVAAAAPLVDRVSETLAAQSLSTIAVIAVADPGSWAQCLAAGLRHYGDAPRHVLIHDIRRPLAPPTLRDRVIAALQAGNPVVMPMLPVTDSVKAVDAQGLVTGTLDRSALRVVQHPRGFTVDRLSEVLAGCAPDDFDELDEALRTGTPIAFVDGDVDAFVVELPRDSAYVEAIIECRTG
jgi:2-C-methyl-D-erythritol 4-phosphate cytidylyltransferase